MNTEELKKANPKINPWISIGLVVLAIYIGVKLTTSSFNDFAGEVSGGNNSNTVSTEPQLELLSSNCTKEYGYFKMRGQVKNISGKSLDNVEAVVSTYTKEKTFVKSESALIDYNPVLPGQVSPFEVLGTDNPAIDSCTVEFKELFGGTILTKKSEQ